MEKHRCILCGAFEAQKNEEGEFYCNACKGHFTETLSDRQISKAEAALGKKFDEWGERQLSNAIHNLWNAVHEEYIDKSKSAGIIAYCQEVQKYLPDDIRAKFYKAVCEGNNATVNAILKSEEILSEENGVYLPDIIKFAIRSLHKKSIIPIKGLIEKVFDGELKTKYLNDLEEEAGKLKEGVYDLSGDAFLAYSSKDIEWVKEICEYLENDKNRLRCFFAYRNLRHVSLGTNSGENDYWESLKTAMNKCTSVVFLSSKNSRDSECDAIEELSYLRYNLGKKPRIEYIGENGEEYSLSDCDRVVEIVLSDAFETRNWCRTRESLCDWIIEQKLKAKAKEKKDTESAAQEEFSKIQEELRKAKEEVERVKCEAQEQVQLEKARAEKLQREAEERAQADKEEQARAAVEQKAEEERKRQEEAEESDRKTREAAAAAEEELHRTMNAAAQKAEEECKKHEEGGYPTLENYDRGEFEIDGTVLVEYRGKGGDVKIPNKVTSIGTGAFYGCSSLTSIKIPNKVTSIGLNAFSGCSSLTSIRIPNKVTSIGAGAFHGCSSLTSIRIPNKVTSIESGAFSGCSSLTSIAVERGNKKYHDEGNCLIETATKTLIGGCVNSVIPADGSVTLIGAWAFSGCSSLTSIRIPNKVTSIGDSAFNGCSSLIRIIIPHSVTSIWDDAFWDCSSLMNFFVNSIITEEGGKIYVNFTGGNKILLPKTLVNRIKNLDEYKNTGKLVTLGVRPEDIHQDEAFISKSWETIVKAKIGVIEQQLDEKMHIYCDIDYASDKNSVVDSASRMIAKISSRATVELGEIVELAFDAMHIHLFDGYTGEHLLEHDEYDD